MTWLLILATHMGGQITMQAISSHRTLAACTEAGRAAQWHANERGASAATMCVEGRK